MGMFDDLIPAAPQQQQQGGMFDDLIPPSVEQPEQPPPAPTYTGTDSGVLGAADAASFGFGDEISGAIGGVVEGLGRPEGFQGAYERVRDNSRRMLGQAQEEHPGAFMGGQVAGGVATSFLPGGAALRGGNLAAKAGKSAAVGAGYGGLYGFGSGDGDLEQRVNEAGKGAMWGAGLGAAGPVIGRGIGKVASKLAPVKQVADSTDALKASAQKAYQRADDAGLVISQPAFGKIVDEITFAVREAGIDKSIHPKATGAFQRLHENALAGIEPSLQDMELLRRVAKSAASSIEPDERRIASIMVDKLDEAMDNISPQDVLAGNPVKGIAALKEARGLWSKVRKSETIQELFEKAKNSAPNFSGSGMENALRTQFRQLANNKSKMRGFNKLEQAAIIAVARGGKMENVLRWMGKFAPTGVVSGALSAGGGFAMGGPAGAAALPLMGGIARKAATRMTKQNARRVDEMVRLGRPLPKTQFPRLERAPAHLLTGSTPALYDAYRRGR